MELTFEAREILSHTTGAVVQRAEDLGTASHRAYPEMIVDLTEIDLSGKLPKPQSKTDDVRATMQTFTKNLLRTRRI